MKNIFYPTEYADYTILIDIYCLGCFVDVNVNFSNFLLTSSNQSVSSKETVRLMFTRDGFVPIVD